MHQPTTDLGMAVEAASAPRTKRALAAGADPSAEDGGTTHLNRASFNGKTAIVKLLLAAGASPDAKDSRGYFPLQLAASGDHGATVKALLALGADSSQRGSRGGTSLHAAAAQGFARAARALTTAGADVHALDVHGSPPITFTCIHGHKKTFGILAKAGSDLSARDETGRTLLCHALRSAYDNRVEYWRSEGTIRDTPVAYEIRDGTMHHWRDGDYKWIDAKGERTIADAHCPPHARYLDRCNIAKSLLRSGQDIEVVDGDGYNALLYASRVGLELVVKLLKDGADPSHLSPDGRSFVHYLALHADNVVMYKTYQAMDKLGLSRDTALVDRLHAPDAHGWRPVHYLAHACLEGDRAVKQKVFKGRDRDSVFALRWDGLWRMKAARAHLSTSSSTEAWMGHPAGTTPAAILDQIRDRTMKKVVAKITG